MRAKPEPAIRAPWPVVVLVGVLVAAHVARVMLGIDAERFALTRADLAAHRWAGLITYLLVHANWAHVLLNSVFILAFGTPVARFLGSGGRGAAAFGVFFIACGVLAALGYAGMLGLLPAGRAREWALIGASGAASGLMGASARLIQGRGRVGSLTGRTTLAMTGGWIVVNLLLGATGLTPGTAGAPVAWQAHILGYFAGALLIGLFARVAGVPAQGAVTKR